MPSFVDFSQAASSSVAAYTPQTADPTTSGFASSFKCLKYAKQDPSNSYEAHARVDVTSTPISLCNQYFLKL